MVIQALSGAEFGIAAGTRRGRGDKLRATRDRSFFLLLVAAARVRQFGVLGWKDVAEA